MKSDGDFSGVFPACQSLALPQTVFVVRNVGAAITKLRYGIADDSVKAHRRC
jgi:hypothetical protein